MNKKKRFRPFVLIIPILLILSIIFFQFKSARETIIFFPLHPAAHFTSSGTHLSIKPAKNSKYLLNWTISSELDRQAYLRQDAGFLFEDGKLKSTLGSNTWKQSSALLKQSKSLTEMHPHLFQAIVFHYGEIHENNRITSVQKMSKTALYVRQSPSGQFESFITPIQEKDRVWSRELNKWVNDTLDLLWKRGMDQWHLQKNAYVSIPLTSLVKYDQSPLPGFTKDQTKAMIGRLWEGLYKNYLLGIKKENGTVVSPVNSSVPLILINKNKKDLLVLIPTAQHTSILLQQSIP